MMLHHEKAETLQPIGIISRVWCLCEKSILNKYQVALVVFGLFLLLNKISEDTKKFDINKLPHRVHPLSLTSVSMNLNYIKQ